jgi:ADP-ribosylglycohydrolase
LIAYDFEDVTRQINKRVLGTRSGRVGIWTDDCSMALSMADSFLLNNYKFNAKHMRYMFHMWLEHGLNNGGRKYSIGLGGNIAISMR